MEEQLTDDQIKELGSKLALMLNAANMPEEEKEAWAALVPEMSIEQIQKLMMVLEANLAEQGFKEMQPVLEEMKEVQAAYDSEVAAADEVAMQKIQALEDQLKEDG